MKKILLVLVVGVSLTGCAGIGAANMFLGVTGAGVQAIAPQMTFEAKAKIEPIEGQQVYPARFKGLRRGLAWISHCEAHGVVVDYIKDWDTLDEETGRVIRKADPNKIHNQALLIYKLDCKGEPPKKILVTAERKAKIFGKKGKLDKNEFVVTNNYFDSADFIRPRWMAQVIKTIQAEAPTNPAAQDFLDSVKIGEDGLPIKPEALEEASKE